VKQIIAFATIFVTSCVPFQPNSTAQTIPATHQSRSLANIVGQGFVAVSAAGDIQRFAVDGDLDTWWTAHDFAPQWFQVTLPHAQPVGKIELIAAQVSPGPSTHWVRMERSGDVVVWHRFDADRAADGHLFALRIDPPQHIDKVRILTTRQVGWVAWREVRILSSALISESVSGLTLPVQLTHAGDGSGRLFVLEKEGRIRIVRDGVLLSMPFLDISQRVMADEVEQGLLNLAFPPSYLDHKRFYVSYTDTNGNTVISRFATSADPDRAEPDSEEIVLTIEQPGTEHNGGTLKFGPRDGYLYISSGDGRPSDSQDMSQHSQDPGTLLGKILRIDVESGVQPYAIPADNPFVAFPGYAPEVWAMGLRNSWGFDFDQLSGDLFIPDTGWTKSEEVNFQSADSRGGENYGWPLFEGIVPIEAKEPVDDLVSPVAIFGRRLGCAVVGGAVNEGQFIYADFCTGRIWSLRRQGQDEWQSRLLMKLGVPISSIGVDESGNLYALGYLDGTIYPLTIAADSE